MTRSAHSAVHRLRSHTLDLRSRKQQEKLIYEPEHVFWGNSRGILFSLVKLSAVLFFFFFCRLCNPHGEPLNSTVPPAVHQRTFDKHHQNFLSCISRALQSIPPALSVFLLLLLYFCYRYTRFDVQQFSVSCTPVPLSLLPLSLPVCFVSLSLSLSFFPLAPSLPDLYFTLPLLPRLLLETNSLATSCSVSPER